MIPKEEGQGVMVSAMCSREFGYGNAELSESVLKEVNENRKNCKYSDENAAILRNGTAMKPLLTCSPFIRELEYGSGHEGYWTYEHMCLQLEDCIDVLKVTHPQFDVIFLLDHSNGHDRLQPNGLSLSKINIKHAGCQPRMRDATLYPTLFGPFHSSISKLQSGSIQHMQYTPQDDGPCYLTDKEKIEQKYDRVSGKFRKKYFTKTDLIEKLKATGIRDPRGNKKVLQEQCTTLNIPIHTQVPVVHEGWSNKPKGSLQALYERGWIDPQSIHLYTANGKKEGDGTNSYPKDPTGCNYSIKALMKLQTDFVQEITLLQFHVQKLGALVDRSPKCHPELAGEGIEYAWALAKLRYRRAAIEKKRSKDKFRNLVRECTNPFTTLNLARIRSCAKKARSYMKLYQVVKDVKIESNVTLNKHSILEGAMKLYLKLKRKGKSHRSVIDRNLRDVSEIENSICVNDNRIQQSNANAIVKKEMIGLLVKKMTLM